MAVIMLKSSAYPAPTSRLPVLKATAEEDGADRRHHIHRIFEVRLRQTSRKHIATKNMPFDDDDAPPRRGFPIVNAKLERKRFVSCKCVMQMVGASVRVKGHRKASKDVDSGCGLIVSLEGRKMFPSTSLNDRKPATLGAYRISKAGRIFRRLL
ncbi:hypothetical protein TcasGA2_TC008055 [Tribolium castaneum]|uniref:Uncharacterized protein n=1 Tax=Tribolium castaneum TaxID=7070 RepID=D1ZZJ2_TRICA|nr:hypothetical protein TcasGA2_TC008055 [Tribolium castaneum]